MLYCFEIKLSNCWNWSFYDVFMHIFTSPLHLFSLPSTLLNSVFWDLAAWKCSKCRREAHFSWNRVSRLHFKPFLNTKIRFLPTPPAPQENRVFFSMARKSLRQSLWSSGTPGEHAYMAEMAWNAGERRVFYETMRFTCILDPSGPLLCPKSTQFHTPLSTLPAFM